MRQAIKDLYSTALMESDGEEEMVEVFADLIIQECLNAIISSTNRPKDAAAFMIFCGGLSDAIHSIKKRFGFIEVKKAGGI